MTQTPSYHTSLGNSANQASYTFAQASHGVSVAAGIVIIDVCLGNGVTASTVTVGGNSASLQVGTGASLRHTSIWTVAHAGGNIGDVVVTPNVSCGRCAVSIFSITGRSSIAANDTATGDTTDPLSGVVDTTVNCYVIASVVSSAGGAFGWTGVTERYDAAIEGTDQFSSASDTITSAGTVTAEADCSGALANGQIVVAMFNMTETYSLTSAAAAFTYTGVAALKMVSRASAAGSYVLSGQDAILRWGRSMAAGAGSYVLSGIAATLNKGWLLVADAAAFVLTGQTSLRAITMNAAKGTYVLTGQVALLTFGLILSAAAGAYAYTGIRAVLVYRLPLAVSAAWVKRKVQATLALARQVAPSLSKSRRVQSTLRRSRQADPTLGD